MPYFHVPVASHHRRFLRFAYRGRHFQVTVFPFGLSLSPRVFTRVVAAALAPLQTQGMKVLPYLDDWLVCAPSRSQVAQDTARLLLHMARLGLTVKLWKELPGPFPKGYLSGDGYGLCRHEALPFTSARGQHPLPPSPLQGRQEAALRLIPTAFGQTDSCLSCGTSGLTDLDAKWHRQRRVRVTLQCLVSLSPWRERAYLAAGMPMGAIPARRELVTTDASLSGWGTVWRGRTAQGRWSAQEGTQHINVLELRAVQLALACFLPHLAGRHVLVRSGQHVHGFPGEPPGGHQVGTASPGIPEPVDLGVSPSGQPAGSLCTGGQESGHGLPLPTEAPTGRMAASSRGGGLDVGPLRQGGGRPLCLGGVDALPPLVLLDRSDQPVGAGRVGTRLAGQTAVCFSTIASDPSNTPQGPFAGPPASAGGSLLAMEALVSTAAQTLLQCAMAPPRQEGPPVTAEGQIWHPDPGRLQLWAWPLQGPTHC